MRRMRTAMMVFGLAGLAAPLAAQPTIKPPMMKPMAAPTEPGAIALDTGGVAGMPPESWFSDDHGLPVARNVSHATLTPFLPKAEIATGAGVIIAPGGAFAQLSMDSEGWAVARWLADHGIAAFVLKYRLNPSDLTLDGYGRTVSAKIAEAMAGKFDLRTPPQALDDATAALRLVRARAREWQVDPGRVGLMGFSAGAMTALTLTETAAQADMPAFVAPIYGPMLAVAVPANAPPIFIALASDDPLFGNQGYGLADSWKHAGKRLELHVFEAGGHGFGLGQPGTTSVDWIIGFRRWLDTNGFLKPHA